MKRASILVAALLLVATACPATAGHARPFAGSWVTRIVATGLPQGIPAPDCPPEAVLRQDGTGVARLTHLGRTTVVFTHCTYLTGPVTGTWDEGITTLTAANGDQLFLADTGTFTLTPNPDPGPPFASSVDQSEWTITGGTGRFADAKGSGTGSATTDELAGVMWMTLKGTITY